MRGGWALAGLAWVALAAPAQAARHSCDLNAPDALHAGPGCQKDWFDANLRLNQLQLVGTAVSAKQAPSGAMLSLIRMGGKKDAEALDFSEPPVAAQLDAGARSLAFDVAYDPQGGLYRSPAGASMAGDLLDKDYVAAMSQPGFKVIHVLDIDFRSSCITLKECLGQVAGWSKAHPGHMPIVIALRTNDGKTPMPGATKPMAFDTAAFDALDKEIKAAFPAAAVITPGQVAGGHGNLRDAVLAGAWPKLAKARGKVLFVLQSDAAKTGLYCDHGLDGRAMFVTADEKSPNAAFVAIDDPVKDAARITADVKAGYIVITHADDLTVEARANDTKRRDAAFASGAQIVQTDFLMPDKRISPYQVSIGDGRHALCDAVGTNCAGWDASAPLLTATAR